MHNKQHAMKNANQMHYKNPLKRLNTKWQASGTHLTLKICTAKRDH
jgi:hypothetical protein